MTGLGAGRGGVCSWESRGSDTGGSTQQVTSGVFTAKSLCQMYVQKSWRKREREGEMGSEGRDGQRRKRNRREWERNKEEEIQRRVKEWEGRFHCSPSASASLSKALLSSDFTPPSLGQPSKSL